MLQFNIWFRFSLFMLFTWLVCYYISFSFRSVFAYFTSIHYCVFFHYNKYTIIYTYIVKYITHFKHFWQHFKHFNTFLVPYVIIFFNCHFITIKQCKTKIYFIKYTILLKMCFDPILRKWVDPKWNFYSHTIFNHFSELWLLW